MDWRNWSRILDDSHLGEEREHPAWQKDWNNPNTVDAVSEIDNYSERRN